VRRLAAVAGLAILLASCSGGPILANPPLQVSSPVAPSPLPSRPADPQPIQLPRDDGPHDRLTEWWYYTGHLEAADGRRFGFEAVVFRAERGDVPTTWASHLALTDEGGQRFLYAQRSEIGPQVNRSPVDAAGNPTGFDLVLSGFDPSQAPATGPLGTTTTPAPWRLAGSNGRDAITAALSPAEAARAGGSFGLALQLASKKPPALHDGNGWVDFGPAGGSYYYSRTDLAVTGQLTLDGTALAVTGHAWFDHQWGDFISVGGGGWDWFAVNLADGRDLTVSLVRDARGAIVLAYGTLVTADGVASHIDAADIDASPAGTWTSPHTGATYSVAWRLRIASLGLDLRLTPTLPDQELDTRPTSGVVYWEGSETVEAADGLTGDAYVELTGYGPGLLPRPS
jgi:predicted secreted hydrolase